MSLLYGQKCHLIVWLEQNLDIFTSYLFYRITTVKKETNKETYVQFLCIQIHFGVLFKADMNS